MKYVVHILESCSSGHLSSRVLARLVNENKKDCSWPAAINLAGGFKKFCIQHADKKITWVEEARGAGKVKLVGTDVISGSPSLASPSLASAACVSCNACTFQTEMPGTKCRYGSKLTQKTCSFAHARYQCSRIHFLLQFLASMCMVLTSTIPAQPVGYRTHSWTPAYILPRWHTMQQAHPPIRAPKQGMEVEGTGKYVLSSTLLSDVFPRKVVHRHTREPTNRAPRHPTPQNLRCTMCLFTLCCTRSPFARCTD